MLATADWLVFHLKSIGLENAQIIAKLHDDQGKVTIPGFYDRIRTLNAEEKAEMENLNYGDEEFLEETGAPATWGESGFSTLERIGARATFEVHGIASKALANSRSSCWMGAAFPWSSSFKNYSIYPSS